MPEMRWIPVDERLPPSDGRQVWALHGGRVALCEYDNGWPDDGVTHWFPVILPEVVPN